MTDSRSSIAALSDQLADAVAAAGFLHRIARTGRSNAFDFSPLFGRVVEHAKAESLRAEREKPPAA